jgi:hypothetical protein
MSPAIPPPKIRIRSPIAISDLVDQVHRRVLGDLLRLRQATRIDEADVDLEATATLVRVPKARPPPQIRPFLTMFHVATGLPIPSDSLPHE